MKKCLGLLFVVALSFSSFANEQTDSLFAQRGQGTEFAQQAADLARDLARNEVNPVEKALLKTSEAEAIYFVGQRVSSKDAKKELHTRGFEAAREAIALLAKSKNGKEAKSDELKTPLARAHYFFAINLGKWGEANGVLSSLSRWPELRDHLDMIDGLDKTVEDYGSSRTRGRAYHKLPFASKDDAEKVLAEAFENTLADGIELSKNSTTVFYYLDILVKTGNNPSKFCEVYKLYTELSTFSDDELAELYNAKKVPETKTDLKNFLENKEFEENVAKYNRNNCR